jgi:glycerate 2-kinase
VCRRFCFGPYDPRHEGMAGMRVVLAPDKFAGTLSAAEAAAAMAAGWAQARPGDELVLAPMADGGEGTIDVLAAAVPGAELVDEQVADARGRACPAVWLRLPDGRAMVESAQACGLSRLAPADRDPLRTTSYGVGQLLRAAAASGAREVVVGLGGSATVDGGAGMATGLGHRLLRADGNGVKVGGTWVRDVAAVRPGPSLGVPVTVASDVTNPLLGPDGAAPVFGPQKGADAAAVALLEEGLRVLADVVERDLPGGPWRDRPGAGAAGGMGFALMAFCGARIVPGAEAMGSLVGLEDALAGAGAVVTGEGSLDASSLAGKAPAHVLARARAHGARAMAVAGRIRGGAGAGFDATAELGPAGFDRPAELVAEHTAHLAHTIEE